jgi:hypothetical protein
MLLSYAIYSTRNLFSSPPLRAARGGGLGWGRVEVLHTQLLHAPSTTMPITLFRSVAHNRPSRG